MDVRLAAVLGTYHDRMDAERGLPRLRAPGFAVNPGAGLLAAEDPDNQRLLAVGPETGRLLNIMARSLEAPTILELGTSFGYSTVWLGEAARASGGQVITIEQFAHKSAYAREMAVKAGLRAQVDFRIGDALEIIPTLAAGIDFVLVDLWKDLYVPCLEAFYPLLNPGAIVVADNMLRPGGPAAERYRRAVAALPGMVSLLLPVGSGFEVSRYSPVAS
ncbi:O-methyltransferase [Radicibacter daui]|uniref:O-methyltransferase n=1 Tax=Radicibacter daui TaxID=3064829 RepID=UPI004046BF84